LPWSDGALWRVEHELVAIKMRADQPAAMTDARE
jgi:hypothetical protein